MSAPPAERITELAPFWDSVSIHEAGHAVIGVLLGVPVDHVQLSYQRVNLLRWEVTGWTAIGPGGCGADLEENIDVLFTLGGLEAEALHITTTCGISLGRARAEVAGRKSNQRDMHDLTASLPASGTTLDEATAWVQATLHDHWQTITYVAAALRDHRFLSGADVARLV